MVEMDESNSFGILNPLCNAVALKPTLETVLKLRMHLDLVPSLALQHLQSYVCFPLLLHLKNTAIGNDVKQHLIDCITHILKKTKILSVVQLFEIYVPVFLQLFDPSKPSLLASVSEETKLSVVQCATQLLRSASSEVLTQMYQTQHIPRLGQGIYICMELLKSERMKSLRLAVIECVMVHCQVESNALFEANNSRFCHQVADIVSLILPGIVVGLVKVITGDPKVGHQVIQMAVRAWGRIIALVFKDRTGADEEPVVLHWHMNKFEEEVETDYQLKPNEELQQILRSPEERQKWLRATGKKVGQQTELAVRVQSSDDWRVRLELVHLSQLILTHCARNLHTCQLPLMEVLVTLMEDSVDTVVTASSAVLLELAQLPQLTGALEENFYQVAVNLPRVIRSAGGEKEQLSAVRLLTGHMRLLGKKLSEVLSSHVHLEKLVLALVKSFQLNTAGISPLEANSSKGMENMETRIFGIGTPWKQYEYFSDQQVLDSLESACSLLGQFSDLEMLIQYFVDMLNEWPEHRKELLLILNQILLTSLKAPNGDVSLARTVVNVYIDPDMWSLPLSVDGYVTLSQARNNIVQACLLVEGIGKIATALQLKFQKLLLKTLYVVLERCGSSQLVLQSAGVEAAQRIATACGYQDVGELVQANQDYISFHVSRKLLRVNANPGVLDVLSVVLAHSDIEMLPHLQGIIQEVLLLNVGTLGDKRAFPFLRVFLASMQALRRWSENHEQNSLEADKTDTSVIKTILEYHAHNTKILSLTEESDEVLSIAQEPSADEEPTEVEKKEDPPPPLILLAEQILQRSIHYLPTRDRTQSLIVLETFNEGVKVLVPYTNHLLPIVHQIWSPLVGRLTQWSDIVIMRRSFELLCTLALTAKDFIRSRTLRDVFPKICLFLSKSCAGSRQRWSSTTYTFTQEFKLQNELLVGLGSLAVCLELMERDVDRILSVVLPYLSKEQPQALQASCVQLLKHLSTFDPDAVWLRLTGLGASNKGSASDATLYEHNLKLLMQYLQSSEENITNFTFPPSRGNLTT